MRITVKFFAVLRDRAATSSLPLELRDGASAADAVDAIAQRFPNIVNDLKRTALAINQEYASRDTSLHDGDELALIPPVSGG